MAHNKTRGLTVDQELNEEHLFRDTRGLLKKFKDWRKVPSNLATLILAFAGLTFFFPSFWEVFLFISFLLYKWGMKQTETAPLKMPIQCGFPDPHQPHPGTGKPTPGQGIFFLGNEVKTSKEVWLTNDDCRQHFLVVGTTGAGKTESLLGFAANALMWGSGFLFCDGKGDVALFAKVSVLARRFGREDDLLVLNFMTGNQDLGASGGVLQSNTLNPFATGSSDSLTQMVVSLMDDAGGDGAMWKGRATAMLTGVMRALCWLRDAGEVDLNVGEIRDFMALKRIIRLGDEKEYPDMPQPIRKSINSYLQSLPGYAAEKKERQAQTTLDQHGYLEMQFTKILGSLADVYGHIFFTPNGEVDMFDVVLNRRILVIMLPALEKSGDEIANLGKIVVATLKGMMGATLGSKLEGSWAEVVENRVTNSPSPFICILDEVGYYTVEGMALMAAQARSLGFSMVYASQDIPAMKRLNEKEAASIIANTNTKIFMRSEEAETTGKLAVESAGKGIRAQAGRFSGSATNSGMAFKDSLEARLETVDRLNWTDLKAQSEGEMHITFKDYVVRAKGFYANPEGALDIRKVKLRANHFVKVPKPDYAEMQRTKRLPEIAEKLTNDALIKNRVKEAEQQYADRLKLKDEIGNAAKVVDLMHPDRKPLEIGTSIVAAVINKTDQAVIDFQNSVREANGFVGDVKPEFKSIVPSREEIDALMTPASTREETGGSAASMLQKKKLRRGIDHTVQVEGDDAYDAHHIDMERHSNSSEAVMQALAALDYSDDTDKESVDKKFSDAIDHDAFMLDRDREPTGISTSDVEDAVSRTASSLFDDVENLEKTAIQDARSEVDDGDDDDDDDGDMAGIFGAEDDQDITVSLLTSLLEED